MKVFGEAIKMGPEALVRYRAEVLLSRGDSGEYVITDTEREELLRIAAEPKPRDQPYAGGKHFYSPDEVWMEETFARRGAESVERDRQEEMAEEMATSASELRGLGWTVELKVTKPAPWSYPPSIYEDL
jgi:hypothetical protein